MFYLIKFITFLALTIPSVHACDLQSLKKSLDLRQVSISGKLHSQVPCYRVRQKIDRLLSEDQESARIQSQIQDLYYLEEFLVSIQIQYIKIDRSIVGQIQVYSFSN